MMPMSMFPQDNSEFVTQIHTPLKIMTGEIFKCIEVWLVLYVLEATAVHKNYASYLDCMMWQRPNILNRF